MKKAISPCLAMAAVLCAFGVGAGSAQATVTTVFCNTNPASHTCPTLNQYPAHEIYEGSGAATFTFGTHTVSCANSIKFMTLTISGLVLESEVSNYAISGCTEGGAVCNTGVILGAPFDASSVYTSGDSGTFKIGPHGTGSSPIYKFTCPSFSCAYSATVVPMTLVGGGAATLEANATLSNFVGSCASTASYITKMAISHPTPLYVEHL